MKFKEFRFVYILEDYLKTLHEVDTEIFYISNEDYSKKPHLGIMTMCGNRKYVIPLTSAKPKHINWRDITNTNYRIYETIDTRTTKIDKYDIIIPEQDTNKLRKKGIEEKDYQFFKKRILSVLEIKKMFPVFDEVYSYADLDIPCEIIEENQRRILMQKEYFFCKDYFDSIEEKATKIYEKQISTGNVLPFYCNFKKLEQVADTYKLK